MCDFENHNSVPGSSGRIRVMAPHLCPTNVGLHFPFRGSIVSFKMRFKKASSSVITLDVTSVTFFACPTS